MRDRRAQAWTYLPKLCGSVRSYRTALNIFRSSFSFSVLVAIIKYLNVHYQNRDKMAYKISKTRNSTSNDLAIERIVGTYTRWAGVLYAIEEFEISELPNGDFLIYPQDATEQEMQDDTAGEEIIKACEY